ncbi:MAG: hypothetical protein AAGA32_10095 [Pseudomonadota bacterium]
MLRCVALVVALMVPGLALAGSDAPRHDTRCPDLARISLYTSLLGGFERLDICPEIIYSATHPLAVGPRRGRVAGPNRGAAYYTETGAIQLSVQVDTSTVPGMAQLLHAMVHVYQHEHGLDGAGSCPRTLERQALEIKARFLSDNGYDAEAEAVAALAALNIPCSPVVSVNR